MIYDPVTYDLECWSLSEGIPDPYAAPEARRVYLRGARSDGRVVRTSHIVSSVGNRVRTATGSIYRLGAPSPSYLAWLEDAGITFDPDYPVKVHHTPHERNPRASYGVG